MMNKKENECRMSKGSEMTRHRCNTHVCVLHTYACVYTRKSQNGAHGELVAVVVKETLQVVGLVDAEVASLSSSYSTSSEVGKLLLNCVCMK